MKKALDLSPADFALIEDALFSYALIHRREADSSCNVGSSEDFHRKCSDESTALFEKIRQS